MERVQIQLYTAARLRLQEQIGQQMEAKGYGRFDYDSLGMGFTLPIDWPAAGDCEITLAQLVALAVKLDMKLIINDAFGLSLEAWS